jgi:hypothetical protein
MASEVVSAVTGAEQTASGRRERLSLDELARVQGVRPITSVAELVRDDVFESDEEVDEFIAFTYAMRHADPA